MKDAFIITDSIIELSHFKEYTKDIILFEDENGNTIEQNIPNDYKSYFSISKNNKLFDLMEFKEQNELLTEFKSFNFFACLFYDFNYLRMLIRSFPTNKKILIYNDHGLIMNREEFLKYDSYENFAKWPNE